MTVAALLCPLAACGGTTEYVRGAQVKGTSQAGQLMRCARCGAEFVVLTRERYPREPRCAVPRREAAAARGTAGHVFPGDAA